jgi:hypothetical protein
MNSNPSNDKASEPSSIHAVSIIIYMLANSTKFFCRKIGLGQNLIGDEFMGQFRWRARLVADGTGLENRKGFTLLVGSNPTPSALDLNVFSAYK